MKERLVEGIIESKSKIITIMRFQRIEMRIIQDKIGEVRYSIILSAQQDHEYDSGDIAILSAIQFNLACLGFQTDMIFFLNR